MDKWTVSRMLDEIARYIELSETNPFKSRAFEKAARKIEALDTDIVQLVTSGKLYATPGIGKGIGPVVTEIVQSGTSSYLEELRGQYPAGIFDLMKIPGLGIKKIGALYSELGIATIDELEEAAGNGRLSTMHGFGAKTAAKILEGIGLARSRTSQFLLPRGIELGEAMRERLAQIEGIVEAEVVGSVRRRLEVIHNVNLLVASDDPAAALQAIEAAEIVDRFELLEGTTAKGAGREELEVYFHAVSSDDFGAAMLRTTGSAGFVSAFETKIAADGYELRGNALYKKGRHVKVRTEQEIFEKAGIAFVDPERREGDEELARKRRVKLIQPTDLRGTFHVHTTFSDGRNTVLEMLSAARERGYEYVGISDHSQAAFYARGLTPDDLRVQHAEIDRHRAEVAPMRVFRGTEADILADGNIDYDRATLAKFDFVIASIHSRFGMQQDEMTERLLRALDNPFVTFLGHLTGRLLLSRQGYSFDFDRVLDRAAERGVMIEINGSPRRLELDWRLVHKAIDRGITLGIHPDAHSTKELNYVLSGTWVARKAGLSTKEIFNARPVEEVAEYLQARRERALR
jgi:DNA polymerase (family 10)